MKPGLATGTSLRCPWSRWGRRFSRLRVLAVATVIVLLLVAVATAWVAVRGRLAQSHLRIAQTQLGQLERELSAGRGMSVARLRQTTNEVIRETAAARRLTGGLVFALAARVPLVGCPVHTTRLMAVAVNDFAAVGLPAIATVGEALLPAGTPGVRPSLVSRLIGVRGSIDTARAAVGQFRQEAGRTSACGAIGRLVGIEKAVTEAVRLSEALARTAQMLDLASGLLRR
ncbi:hypothetical protein [Frankia sp. CiP3]|uniref:hypothetical protein n=1 Tax=Frankia sp. CiP3 TaxID=2880971 RepID=UPI001EF50D53|nr:hypothetical protein [Frankia sp. CiP3]